MQVFLALPRYPFTRAAIEFAPEEPGVFGLFEGQELIYIGRADDRRDHSLRSQLLLHQDGVNGDCTMRASHYTWEIVMIGPAARETEILARYFQAHRRQPRCCVPAAA